MIASQVRFPEDTLKYIRQEADRLGVSQNSFILVLLEQGRKVWASDCIIHQG